MCYLTFALPAHDGDMRAVGEQLDAYRRELMLARQSGLTKTYSLVHNPGCLDSDIDALREVHRQLDYGVVRAYGWDDLDLDHAFYETPQGVRYTIGPIVRQEILDRLLELNHERYATEVAAGLHEDSKKDDGGGMRLF